MADRIRAVAVTDGERKTITALFADLKGSTALIEGLDPEEARAIMDPALQLTLGPALQAVKGWVTPEVEQLYRRSRELCRRLGESTQSAWVLLGLWVLYMLRAEYQKSREISKEILLLTQDMQDPAMRVVAHYAQVWDCFAAGEIVAAREHCEQIITLYDSQQRSSARYGLDFGVVSRVGVAHALWLLGYPAQTLQRVDDAQALAQQLSHLPSMTFALHFAAILYSHRREGHAVKERAGAAIALAQEHGFPMDLASETILHGWALAEQGQGEEGIAQMRQGLAACRVIGAEVYRPYYLALLAEAYGQSGQIDNGLATVAEALDLVNTTGERFYEAELYRLKGELLLARARQRATGNREE